MKCLNIGILAHVDAGKTSLTERLLFNTGAIKSLGSVDRGDTQTDSMELERQRGITIKSAVASFNVGSRKVNLLDTPGHPDFIAEVERALKILDLVVLVISAVEGIQPQTSILMKTLRRLKIPTLIFINKIDRMGARSNDVVEEIKERLFPEVIVMNSVTNIGSKEASVTEISKTTLENELQIRINKMEICPIFFGSAITGSGIPTLLYALENYLVIPEQDSDNTLSAVIFKIERGTKGEKVAYARMYSGDLNNRNSINLSRISNNGFEITLASKITNMEIFQNGKTQEVLTAYPGDIVKIWGLNECQIGDWIGKVQENQDTYFPKPSLEVVLKPRCQEDRVKLRHALDLLSEQDPLIQFRQSEKGILSIKLYGEVQREVIETLLQNEYHLEVDFEKTQTIYVEKPKGIGKSFAEKDAEDNLFVATLGFTVGPGSLNSGLVFKPGPGIGGLPVAYIKAVEEAVYKTFQQGLFGWEVTDCVVEVTAVGYWDATSTIGDFRGLTPLLLMEALQKAGTDVYEPLNDFELDIPNEILGKVLQIISHAEGKLVTSPILENGFTHLRGLIPVRKTNELERSLPDLTQGKSIFTTKPAGYQKSVGTTPTNPRTDNNPLNKNEYLRRTLKRG